MADNLTAEAVVTPGATFVTALLTFSGDSAALPGIFSGILSGSEGAWTFTIAPGGSGVVTAGTPRVVLATDVALPTGANVIGAVTASGTFPVSVVSLPLPTGAATLAGQTQPGVDIGDVTINNASGASAVNIQDGGNIITVDGTVTVNAGTNLNTSALALEAGGNLASAVTALQIIDNIVSGSEAQVDIVAALPAGTNNIGDVDILSIAAGDNNIGNVDIVTLPALVAGSANIGDVDIASIAAGDNNIGNVDVVTLPALAAGTNLIGYVGHGKTIKTVSGSLTADTDVIAAVASKRLKVIAYSLIGVGTNANTVIFKSNGTAGTELWRVLMQSSTAIAAGANLAIAAPSFLFATVAGEKLTMDVSQTDTIHYSITYFDDDAT